ncbi:MAG TPA: AsmA family protein [Pseudolabrys sp.]|nr:AsmA family protein [Pseudolabrys sp.]
MTAAAGLKRLGFALLAMVAVGGGLVIADSTLISADAVRQRVLSEIRTATGLTPTLRGPVTVSLFPSGRVTFADVTLGAAGKPALTAEKLTARLRFFPLLIGRVEIADVSLEQPTITVEVGPNGRTNWSGLIEALASSQKPDAERSAAFSEMRIDNGTIVVRDSARALSETLDDVQFSLAWPSISNSFGATGRFVWHDEVVDASLTLGDFAAALAGKRTGVKLRLAAASLKGGFEGAMSVKPTLKIEGTLAADTESLRDAMLWIGKKPLPGGGFGHFAIKAEANVTGGTVGLTNVNLELDGNTAEGVLTFAADGRQTVQGTLAADALDLTPYISTAKLLTANQRAWNNGHINLKGLSGMDLDLRLSAAKVTLADAKLGRTAIGANLRNGQLVVTVGEAQAYGGMIKGSLTLANFENGVDVKSQLQFSNVNLEPCLDQLFGLHRLEGTGNMTLALEGRGASVLAVAHNMNGTASLSGKSGALVGLNVEQLLRRLERRPLSGPGAFHTGSTPFDTIDIALNVLNGTATVKEMKITGPAVQVAMTGSASIPGREFDLTGTAALVAAAKPGAQPFELPFVVQGTWDDPVMLPDAEALIRRSGAAAPLLNAAREQRRARDAVQSVIERLTGHGVPKAVPAAEQSTPPSSAKAE